MVRYAGALSECVILGQPAGSWYYRVRASNAAGDSPWSNVEVTHVIPDTPLLSPIDNTDGDGIYWVDWSDSTGADSYSLEEDDNPGFISPTVRYTGAASEFQVTGQASGVWHYRVCASNAGGDSFWSNAETVHVAPDTPVLFPIDNADRDGTYWVDWSDVSGGVWYRLQEDSTASFSTPTTRYQGTSSQFQVTGQDDGTWYYRVYALNGGGASPWSGSQSATVGPSMLYLPLLARNLLNDPYEPNDSFGQAWGPLASGQTYRAYFPRESDLDDYYYLDLPAAHTIEIWLTAIPAGNDYALYLYDQSAGPLPIDYSDEYGNADEHISLPGQPAGRYYIRVERVIGTSRTQPYALRAVFQ
jgi:hypothetical protein